MKKIKQYLKQYLRRTLLSLLFIVSLLLIPFLLMETITILVIKWNSWCEKELTPIE